ncbi:MAG: hypothetical protein Q9165_007652 [Trypethelium subeluteriae]
MPRQDQLQEPKPSFVSNLKASARGLSRGLLDGGLENGLSSPLASSAAKSQTLSDGHRNHRHHLEKLALLPKATNNRNHPHEGFRSKNSKDFEGNASQGFKNETNLQFNFQAFLQGNQNGISATPVKNFDQLGDGESPRIFEDKDEPIDSVLKGSSSERNNHHQHHSVIDSHFRPRDELEVRKLLSDTNLDTDPTPMERHYGKSLDTAIDHFHAPDQQSFVDTSQADLPESSNQSQICTEGLSDTLVHGTNFDEFLSEWKHVLDSYTKEVWGDLLPAMSTAKSEVNASAISQQKSGQIRLSASRRLELLCGHIARATMQSSPRHMQPIQNNSKTDSRGRSQPEHNIDTNLYHPNNQAQASRDDEEEVPLPPFHCPQRGQERVDLTGHGS